ncbi:MAG: hypothetical protein IKD78_02125 [Bacteroidales bacterium]|nr:hypothetical protein [Bacteroidales bacterium]
MNNFSDIIAYVPAIIGGRSRMLRPDTGICRLYPEDGAEFCRRNHYWRFGEMFQVAGDDFRSIFGKGRTVVPLALSRRAAAPRGCSPPEPPGARPIGTGGVASS